MNINLVVLKLAARRSWLAAGFTLIELMVVLGIVVLMSLIILVSSSRFNSAILLRSLAYQVGLSIREAQLYGVAVRKAPALGDCAIGPDSVFCASFGVHFPTPPSTRYVLFPDINNNAAYDDTDANGKLHVTETFTAQYGFTISNICVPGSGSIQCSTSCPSPLPPTVTACAVPTTPAITSLDIAFRRPNPDAVISVNGNPATRYAGALIEVSAPGGAKRSISVSLTGQIVIMALGS